MKNLSQYKENETKIKFVCDESIEFENGMAIEYFHNRECCEENYLDFEQLEPIARGYIFELPIIIEACDCGIRFGDRRLKFFVPCYSIQNGFYSRELDVVLKDADGELLQRVKVEDAFTCDSERSKKTYKEIYGAEFI